MVIGFSREHVCCFRLCMSRWQHQCRRLATWSIQWPLQPALMPHSWDTRYDSACSLWYFYTTRSSLLMTLGLFLLPITKVSVQWYHAQGPGCSWSRRCLRWRATSSRSSWQPLALHQKYWTASSRWAYWTRQRLWQSLPYRCSIQPKKQAATLRCVFIFKDFTCQIALNSLNPPEQHVQSPGIWVFRSKALFFAEKWYFWLPWFFPYIIASFLCCIPCSCP